MTSLWSELSSVEHWTNSDEKTRAALVEALASSLGPGFAPTSERIGELGFVVIIHERTELVLVAVPGGEFVMGLCDDEVEGISSTVFNGDNESYDQVFTQWHLPQITPPHPVNTSPFLCAREPASRKLAKIIGDIPHDLIEEDLLFTPSQVPAFVSAVGLRLLSSAEWEWVAREGGHRSWIIDIPAGKTGMDIDFCDSLGENAWGIRKLKSDQGEWVADGWHPNYSEAPSDSFPWEPKANGEPGVHRGAHTCWQSDAEAVTCHAALREEAGPYQLGAVRFGLDLPS